jgi:hypothetical protein
MALIRIAGDTSGFSNLAAPAVAGSNTYTFDYPQGSPVTTLTPVTIANGTLLMGNTISGRLEANTLVAGTGISVTNGPATITIASTISTVGLHTIWVPAWAMYPTVTNGASAANGFFELVTNDLMLKTLDYDTTTSEKAQFSLKLGNSWNLGTVTAKVVWSHGTTATNFGVSWSVSGRAFSDNEAGDAALGTPMVFSDTGGTANNIYISPASGGITIGGTPADGDWIIMEVLRSVANASDNMAIDARLHGVELTYTTDADTDA